MTGWICLAALLAVVVADWYFIRRWRMLVRGWRNTCRNWEKACKKWKRLLKEERKIGKRWRDLYKGRDVFMPFNVPADGKLPEGRWEFVEMTTVPAEDGAPTTTITTEEKP